VDSLLEQNVDDSTIYADGLICMCLLSACLVMRIRRSSLRV